MRVSASYRPPVLLSRAPPEGDRCAPVLAASAAVVSRPRTFSALPATTIRIDERGKKVNLLLLFFFFQSFRKDIRFDVDCRQFIRLFSAVS